MDPNWDELYRVAKQMSTLAYAPYSNYQVGAAAQVDDQRVVRGCNIENASYGLTLCAECALIADLIASGGGRLVAFCCVDKAGNTIMACGRCRQLLWEHGGADLLVATPQGVQPMSEILPQAFDARNLES